MRLNITIEAEGNFARWQLEVGQGMHTDEGGNITLPGSFKCEENKVASLINTIYSGINAPLSNPRQYFLERTILSTLNTEVDCLNARCSRSSLGKLKYSTVQIQFPLLSKVVKRISCSTILWST